MIAGAALAATIVVGGVLGLVRLNSPPAVPAAPTPVPRLAAPPLAADVAPPPPPAPLALAVTEPVASAAPAAPPPKARRPAAPRPLVAKAAPSQAPPSCGRLDCQEAGLDVLDQELNTAYAQAIRSSAAAGPLSAQQERWVIRQERLRRDDPAMAADLYRARIAELRELAARGDEAPAASP